MKKLLTIIITFSILLTASLAVSADEAVSVKAWQNTENFLVTVNATGLSPNARLAVVAVSENTEIITAMQTSSTPYFAQKLSGPDGSLNIEIPFSSDAGTGNYRIYITDGGTAIKYASDIFFYVNKLFLEDMLQKVNSGNDTTLISYFADKSVGSVVDNTEYILLPDAFKNSVVSIFVSERPRGGFGSINEVQKAFSSSVLTVAVTKSDNPYGLICKYGEAAGIDTTAFDAMSEQKISKAMDFVTSKSYTGIDELRASLNEGFFVADAALAQTASALKKLFLETYADELDLNLTSYKKLSDPNSVFAELLKKDINGFDEASELFDDAVRKQKPESGKTSTGGGGGGGSSSFGGLPASDPTPSENSPNLPPAQTYTDIASVPWALDSIMYLTQKGVLSGDGNGLFRPDSPVTRAEFIKIIISAFGIPLGDSFTAFDDVPADAWYAPYVSAGVKSGIVKGFSNEYFGSAENISRQDMAVMCVRALGDFEPESAADIKPGDVSAVSEYALSAVNSLYAASVISGDQNGNFRPMDFATRAEAAKIVAGILKLREG